jgi:2'-5' RNA ligase
MSTIRSFVAIPLERELLNRIEQFQRELRSLPADVKWVNIHSIHLTLKFLGDVDDTRIGELGGAIERAREGFTPWIVPVKEAGAFPSLRNPRVVWIGIQDQTGELAQLQGRMEKEFARLGFAEEGRPFSPHLTLGRVRSSRGKPELIRYLVDETSREFGEIAIAKVVLFRSELKPSGAVYTSLKEFTLQ